MQQIKSTVFRVCSTGWQTNNYDQKNTEITVQVKSILRKAASKRGAYLVNSYIYWHRIVAFCPMIYFRYHQRSRLRRWIVGYLNRREGVMAPINTRYFVLYKNNPDSFSSIIQREKAIKRVFPKADVKPWEKGSREARAMRGWVDLELNVFGTVLRRNSDSLIKLLRESLNEIRPRAEFRVYNVFDFVDGVNPLKALRFYLFQRFSKMRYQADIISAMYVATQTNLSNRMSHAIMLGMERHAGRKRQQKRFIAMVRTMSERIIMWNEVKKRPLWRISMFGKFDAKMRRAHELIRVGFIRYQEVDFITNYSAAVASTKYGTTSVRVWMRNMLN